jgi:hypothetical protein
MVSNVEHILALPQNVFRLPIVNRHWRQQTYAGVTVLLVIPLKKTLTERTTVLDVLDAPKAVRELRAIFQGSELALEKGLSSETCGRLCVFVTPRSARKSATGLDLIEVPRSACRVS